MCNAELEAFCQIKIKTSLRNLPLVVQTTPNFLASSIMMNMVSFNMCFLLLRMYVFREACAAKGGGGLRNGKVYITHRMDDSVN